MSSVVLILASSLATTRLAASLTVAIERSARCEQFWDATFSVACLAFSWLHQITSLVLNFERNYYYWSNQSSAGKPKNSVSMQDWLLRYHLSFSWKKSAPFSAFDEMWDMNEVSIFTSKCALIFAPETVVFFRRIERKFSGLKWANFKPLKAEFRANF